jgi:hypothetical protein
LPPKGHHIKNFKQELAALLMIVGERNTSFPMDQWTQGMSTRCEQNNNNNCTLLLAATTKRTTDIQYCRRLAVRRAPVTWPSIGHANNNNAPPRSLTHTPIEEEE